MNYAVVSDMRSETWTNGREVTATRSTVIDHLGGVSRHIPDQITEERVVVVIGKVIAGSKICDIGGSCPGLLNVACIGGHGSSLTSNDQSFPPVRPKFALRRGRNKPQPD